MAMTPEHFVQPARRMHSSGGEVHSDDIKIEQRPAPQDPNDREGDVIIVDASALAKKDFLDALAFMEEPVTIRLEPSADRHAIAVFPVWCNGEPAQIWENGGWNPIGWLPVGRVIIIKRKILEIIVRTKLDTLKAEWARDQDGDPHNTIQRYTSAVHSFSVIEDKNPRGVAWLTEMRRRNY